MATVSQSPHDALIKRALSEKENAIGELRSVLPSAIVAALDFDTLSICPGSYVDESLRDLHSDLLYSIELGGREALVYVLYEHQSRVDGLMPFRLLRYVVRIWDDFRREHPEAKRLPAVIPVVLHHGKIGWTGPTRLHELIDLEPDLLAAVREHVPEFRMLLDDLGVQTEEAIYRRAMSAYGRLVLWALRSAGIGGLHPETVGLWAAAFRDLSRAPGGREAIETLFRYLIQVLGDEGRDVIEVLANRADGGVKEAYVTLYETIREEGREEGQRALMLKLFTLKFGAPSENTRRRVAEATSADLDAWAERILSVARVEDLWG